MYFSFVSAVVDSTILVRTSSFDPSSDMVVPRYLKLDSFEVFYLPPFNDPLDSIGAVGHDLCFLCTDLHTLKYVMLSQDSQQN